MEVGTYRRPVQYVLEPKTFSYRGCQAVSNSQENHDPSFRKLVTSHARKHRMKLLGHSASVFRFNRFRLIRKSVQLSCLLFLRCSEGNGSSLSVQNADLVIRNRQRSIKMLVRSGGHFRKGRIDRVLSLLCTCRANRTRGYALVHLAVL